MLGGDDPVLNTLNTANDLEMKREAEARQLTRMAKVHDILEMWQGGQNLVAMQDESHTQRKQRTAIGCISDTEEIIRASKLLFQHDGVAAFTLSERSPLPPALSAKGLPGGRTQIITVRRIRRIHHHPVETDDVSTLESISDIDSRPNWNIHLVNPIDSEDNCAADIKSIIERDNGIKDQDNPEQQDASALREVPGFIRPTGKWMRQAEKVLLMVIAMELRKNKRINKQ